MRRTIFSFVVLLCLSASVWSADALRVGISPDYPPLGYKHEDRIVGIEADNAVALGKVLGRDMRLVEMPFESLIPALKSGQIDIIMSGMTMTEERSEQVMFVNPYMRVGQMAIMHESKVARYSQPWAIYREGIRIGVEPGTTGEAYAQRELPDAFINLFDNPDAAFAALRADKIDLYIHDAPTSWQLANGRGDNSDLISLYSPLTEEDLAWAIPLGEQDLLQEINNALAVMRSSGTLSYILNRWIPVRVEVSR